jgi:hypothetical protein
MLSTSAKDRVVQIAQNDRRKPFRDIGNELAPRVSRTTVRVALAEHGYHRCVGRKVPYLSEAAKCKRLAWAQEVASMTEADWSNVAWSDEAYVCLGENNG